MNGIIDLEDGLLSPYNRNIFPQQLELFQTSFRRVGPALKQKSRQLD